MEEEVSSDSALSPWYSGRTAARLLAIQGAYATLFSEYSCNDIDDIFAHLCEMREVLELERVDKKLLMKLLELVLSKHAYVDSIISENITEKWSMDRINLVSRAILRAGICEMLYLQTNDTIVINEYVKIAAASLDDSEINFVNAILNKAKCSHSADTGSRNSHDDISSNDSSYTFGANSQMVGFEFTDTLENSSLNF